MEVGCRGFAGLLLNRAFKALGVRGLHNRRAIKNITGAAEKDGCGSGGVIRVPHKLLRDKLGVDHPQLGHVGKGV